MHTDLPTPPPEAILYEDDKLYACLATYPITRGHVVVVWKTHVQDLHYLGEDDYDFLMDAVNRVRDAMLKSLDIEKVYLIYMDEAKHVHWHLVPRYNEKGFDVFEHEPEETNDFSLTTQIKAALV
jgi:histidine triad (HIT) family protein